MGFHSYVQVGPYLRVPHQTRDASYAQRQCKNEGHTQFSSDAKFCPQCGSPIISVTVPETKLMRLTPARLPAGLDDSVFVPETLYAQAIGDTATVWLPCKGGTRLDSDDEPLALTPAYIETALAEFASTYDPLIHYLEATYGFKVEVHYGVVVYQA
jgi:hypothetical protein